MENGGSSDAGPSQKAAEDSAFLGGGIPSVSQGIDGAGWSVWEISHPGKSSALNETGGVACGMSLLSVP